MKINIIVVNRGKMRVKPTIIFCFFIGFICSAMFSSVCYAKSSEDGVCKSPYLEVTRYKWEGNKWKYLRDSDSKTFEIEDITFNVSLVKKGISIKANGTELVYIDYNKYQSNLKDYSKSRKRQYTTFHNFKGKRVMVRILNFAPEQETKDGFRWCILELYVESTKSLCESAGGTFVGGFPYIPLIEMDYK